MDGADVIFPPAEADQFARDLAVADVVIAGLAPRHRCRVFATAGKGWPGRTLERRVRLRKFELRVMLNPKYFERPERFYEVWAQWSWDFAELYRRQLDRALVATFSPEQMRDEALLSGTLSRALEHHLR